MSVREQDVLNWLSLGKSGNEIAVILGIRVCTVRMHIRNLVEKLEASNIPHAITQAFHKGVLIPAKRVDEARRRREIV
ncbi:MAG: helix-turn-helix transcriptional regulator [Gammaproteobacteria bacterium]|nr:helix-turn-helix transcriptional regulator [Gammaproteobacteria bacterium]